MKKRLFVTFLVVQLLVLALRGASSAAAQDPDQENLELFQGNSEEIVTTARAPRPASQIAENVTVITAAQIAELNAHTLAEVLQTVPGIQLEQVQTPGSFAFFSIQGAASFHVLLLIDGVPQNWLLQGESHLGVVPVQQIERIEIIKGAASAAWGQALGGVINVVTKGAGDKTVGGSVTASYGEGATRNLRGEVTGSKENFGYYLAGGNLNSHGLLPNNGVNLNNVYSKFSYDLPSSGNVTFGVNLNGIFNGVDESARFHDSYRENSHYSFLNLSYPLNPHLNLEVLLRESTRTSYTRYGNVVAPGSVVTADLYADRESTRAANANLAWSVGPHKLVLGTEFEHDEVALRDQTGNDPVDLDRTADKVALYGNAAIALGKFTLLPGARYDHTGFSGDVFSGTLGATYLVSDKTVLRGYGARGYSLPTLLWSHGPPTVWTGQIGFETSDLPNLWLKGTLFYNEISNIEDSNNSTSLTKKQIREGWELELRTVPLYSFSVSAGYTVTDAYDSATGKKVDGVPAHLAKLGLHYDNSNLGLSGVLFGNYVVRYVNADPPQTTITNPHDHGVLWDLTLTQRLPHWENSPEIFFSAHNLFNGTQYLSDLYKNAGRWLEGGVRFKF